MANGTAIKKQKGVTGLINARGSNQANDGLQEFAEDLFPATQEVKKKKTRVGGVERKGTGSFIESANQRKLLNFLSHKRKLTLVRKGE
jgi:hypothetical protein